ncbi:hypothetical protein KGQ20_02795 [Catenulispora sp. NF23]|uniref:PRC-barrel domain containing protein n=1 Tax=Catenulispora pinistramenti TaxID=2705254 RepID=A0ABS5KM92_9ACTN|nr:hypothetical protein [Catenulispora pinistramenti]MBS2531693.1 hypothetical protein [Catenulispora pinistramenti]MBS2547136.1 hypothetical protein [Catenulispora pinistramenti]
MTTDTPFLIGAEVHSADGIVVGRLTRVVVDPVAKALTDADVPIPQSSITGCRWTSGITELE